MNGLRETRAKIILNSVFFVLGFSLVFSVLGVLLQSVFSGIAYDLRNILGYIAGALIIFFGLVMMGLIKIGFLQREHRLRAKKSGNNYVASFVFGSAFAVGWTPCVGAVLGAVLTLAVTSPEVAFPMMLAYSIGLGLPFILAAVFIAQARGFIEKATPFLKPLNFFFGLVLVILGVLVFTNTLSAIANFAFAQGFTFFDETASNEMAESPNIIIALVAGFFSFLSPCVLPLVPAYLTFIAGTTIQEAGKKE